MSEVLAAYVEEVGGEVKVGKVSLAAPQTGEVRVAIRAVGVCHSDLSVQDGTIPYVLPCVLGHECAGEVLEVGPEVTSFAVGDRVVAQWVPMCRECGPCKRGEPFLCDAYLRVMGKMDDGSTRLSLNGQTLHHGVNVAGFSEQIVIRQTALTKLEDDVPFEIGAIVGCAVLTGWGTVVNVGDLIAGESVVVFGAGAIGLSAALGAKAEGAGGVLIVDPVEERRTLAAEASDGWLGTCAPEEAEKRAIESFGGRPDMVVDAVGRAAVQEAGLALVRSGGRLVVAGMNPTETVTFPAYYFALQAKQIRGSWLGGCDPKRDVARICAAWREGRLPLERLITNRRSLAETPEAIEDLKAGRGIRTVLLPG